MGDGRNEERLTGRAFLLEMIPSLDVVGPLCGLLFHPIRFSRTPRFGDRAALHFFWTVGGLSAFAWSLIYKDEADILVGFLPFPDVHRLLLRIFPWLDVKIGVFDVLPYAMLLFAGINCLLTELIWFVARTLLDDRAKRYFSQPDHLLRNSSIIAASFHYNGLILFLAMINSVLIRIMGAVGYGGINLGSILPRALFLASYYVATDMFFMTFIVLPIWTARVYAVKVSAVWAAASASMVCIVVPAATLLTSVPVPPPPPPPPAVSSPAPPPSAEGTGADAASGAIPPARNIEVPASTFLVFFELGKDELPDRANEIIAEAAAAVARRGDAARVVVSGHSDTSGADGPAVALSAARALAVARQLMRAGVPEAGIALEAFGSARPLVPTGPGVSEPQNRRVEIVVSHQAGPN